MRRPILKDLCCAASDFGRYGAVAHRPVERLAAMVQACRIEQACAEG